MRQNIKENKEARRLAYRIGRLVQEEGVAGSVKDPTERAYLLLIKTRTILASKKKRELVIKLLIMWIRCKKVAEQEEAESGAQVLLSLANQGKR